MLVWCVASAAVWVAVAGLAWSLCVCAGREPWWETCSDDIEQLPETSVPERRR